MVGTFWPVLGRAPEEETVFSGPSHGISHLRENLPPSSRPCMKVLFPESCSHSWGLLMYKGRKDKKPAKVTEGDWGTDTVEEKPGAHVLLEATGVSRVEEITNQVKCWDPLGGQGLRTENPVWQSGGKSLVAVVGVVNSDWSKEFGRSASTTLWELFLQRGAKKWGHHWRRKSFRLQDGRSNSIGGAMVPAMIQCEGGTAAAGGRRRIPRAGAGFGTRRSSDRIHLQWQGWRGVGGVGRSAHSCPVGAGDGAWASPLLLESVFSVRWEARSSMRAPASKWDQAPSGEQEVCSGSQTGLRGWWCG